MSDKREKTIETPSMDDGTDMWAASQADQKSESAADRVKQHATTASADDFADLEISPDFKSLKSDTADTGGEYERALFGTDTPPRPEKAVSAPAPAPAEITVAAAAATTTVTPAASVAAVAAQAEAAGKPAQSKLPIFAAVAASIACAVVLGAKSWPSATASGPTDPVVAAYAPITTDPVSAPQPAAVITASSASFGTDTTQQAMAAPSTSTSLTIPVVQQPDEASNLDAPMPLNEEPTLAAAQQPNSETILAALEQPSPKSSFAALTPPTLSAPTESISDVPHRQASFTPLAAKPNPVALSVSSLSRANCEARVRAVSQSGAINFKSGSATLLPSSDPMLRFFASVFNDCREFNISVAGHTDSVGPANANQALSEQRALSVARRLVEIGIPKGSIRAVGFGESRPLASNDTVLRRSRNRRIEFLIDDG